MLMFIATAVILCSALMLGCYSMPISVDSSSIPLPSKEQLDWSRMEIGAMVSWGMETWAANVSDIGFCTFNTGLDGRVWYPAYDFNPSFLDMDQWAKAMLSFGAKYAVFTAKHCSGFALWPTKVRGYDYNIANSLYMNGNADIVRMFVDTCIKYGIKPGLYYATNDNYYLNIDDYEISDAFKLIPGQRVVSLKEYDEIVLEQLKELWTLYGDLVEIWFDGGEFIDGIDRMLVKYQPRAVTFQGPQAYANNIRWVGSEDGEAPYPCWSTTTRSLDFGAGASNGTYWAPAETDLTVRADDRWFWAIDYFTTGLKTPAFLFGNYERSVGRNTNFLLNLSPDPFGLVPLEDLMTYQRLGKYIQDCYDHPLTGSIKLLSNTTWLLDLGTVAQVNRVVLAEDQSKGQLVRNYTLYYHATQVPNATSPYVNGSSIGNKRIEAFSPVVFARYFMLVVTDYFMNLPTMRIFSAFNCNIPL